MHELIFMAILINKNGLPPFWGDVQLFALIYLYMWVDPLRLDFYNQSKNNPTILLFIPIKIWGKSVQGFLSYDQKSELIGNVCFRRNKNWVKLFNKCSLGET